MKIFVLNIREHCITLVYCRSSLYVIAVQCSWDKREAVTFYLKRRTLTNYCSRSLISRFHHNGLSFNILVPLGANLCASKVSTCSERPQSKTKYCLYVTEVSLKAPTSESKVFPTINLTLIRFVELRVRRLKIASKCFSIPDKNNFKIILMRTTITYNNITQ